MAVLRSYADLAREVLAATPRCGPIRVVAVDGRAGSGKTTFAGRLARALGPEAHLLHIDDLLESGWEDLQGFRRQLRSVLDALAAGGAGSYRAYDWAQGRLGTDRVSVPPAPVLVVDGVGAALATRGRRMLAVRVEAPADVRLARGVARDGEALRPQWERWMTLEDAHFAEAGSEVADLVVDGTGDGADERRFAVMPF